MNRRDFISTGSAAVAATALGGCATVSSGTAGKLALLGGSPVVPKKTPGFDRLFKWPIVNDAMRQANDRVLCEGAMSGTAIADEFDAKFAAWNGCKYGLSSPNGTMSLIAAFYGVGLGPGDELICPSITYWASCLGAVHLGASVVFCDVKADDLTVDPASFEAHITPRTKAIVVVHLYGQPCDMDAIMAIAKKHGIRVIEDVSHAQGGLYKGRKLGTFGDVAAMSLMSSKSFAIGEGGMLVTDDYEIYRRAIRWGSYERIGRCWSKAELARTKVLPVGGVKNRLNQCCAAIGLEQLKKYDPEIAEIEKAMLYYWQGLSDIPGLKIIYPKYANSNKAGWYFSRAHYDAAALKGVPVSAFVRALNAETGGGFDFGLNFPLHTSSLFEDEDIFGKGVATPRRNLPPGVSPAALTGKLPIAETRKDKIIGDPAFKRFDKPLIDRFVEAVHKVYANLDALRTLPLTEEDQEYLPGWNKKA